MAAGCGSVCITQLMPTCDNPGGKCATVMNMYTAPQHRRKGIGQAVLAKLVAYAKQQGCGRILLEASEQGRLLYEKNGFVPAVHEMVAPLHPAALPENALA